MAISSDQSNTTTPSALTFPPQHYAKLSPLPFLTSTLSRNPTSPSRPNGRAPLHTRTPTINTSSLTNTNGSAVIRLGSTSVVCGVRAELLPTSHIHGGLPRELEEWDGPDASSSSLSDARSDAELISDLQLLVPNLELNTGCSPAHIPGNAPGEEAQSLTQRMITLLRIADLVPLRQLLVWEERALGAGDEDEDAMATDNPNNPGDVTTAGVGGDGQPKFRLRAIWTLYIDILYISLDGSAFSAGWLALLAALRDTSVPAARWDDEREMVVCSSDRTRAVGLELRAMPVPLSAVVVRGEDLGAEGVGARQWMLVDADDFEEAVAEGEVTVVVVRGKKEGKASRKGRGADVRLIRLEAGGRVPGASELKELVERAAERFDVWTEALKW